MAEHGESANEAQAQGPAPAQSAPLDGLAAALVFQGASREKADAFLDKQGQLLDLQMEHLHEERELHHRHLSLKYFGDRLRIWLQLLGIAIGVLILSGLGALVWSAANDRGLVVESFSVPPDLAARGLTGQVVATRLLDKLAAMQDATDTARPANSYKNNWGGDLKVEIPDTGVSFAELGQFLRRTLGHETHITGEIVRTATGLSITARTEEGAAKTFEGADADLDALTQQSAEAIYEATQPYRYAIYLVSTAGGVAFHPTIPFTRSRMRSSRALPMPPMKPSALGR